MLKTNYQDKTVVLFKTNKRMWHYLLPREIFVLFIADVNDYCY